jgi:NAD(P)-dependent dehydrogenase (short-subunit alcohol dehydrogenase family)
LAGSMCWSSTPVSMSLLDRCRDYSTAFDKMVDVNLKGPWYLASLAPRMGASAAAA